MNLFSSFFNLRCSPSDSSNNKSIDKTIDKTIDKLIHKSNVISVNRIQSLSILNFILILVFSFKSMSQEINSQTINSQTIKQISNITFGNGSFNSNSSTLTISDLEPKIFTTNSKLTVMIYGRQVSDIFSKSNQAVSVINPEVQVKYGNRFLINLDLVALYGTGNASNFWNDEGKAPGTILLNDASVKFNIHENIFVKAGAIKTSLNPLLTIMTDSPFIGSQQSWQIGADNSNITVSAIEAIPSAGQVSRRLYEESTQAYFLSQTLAGKWKQESWTSEIKLAATRFQFENLSTNIANDCVLIGNSPDSFEGTGKAFRFKYGFMGTEYGAHLSKGLGDFELSFRGSSIINDAAPSDRNKGNQYGAALKYSMGNISIKPGYTRFNYDSDVTPASYTTLTGRYHNRDGYRASLDVELKKEKLAFKGYYMKADEKVENGYLSDREIYNLSMEAKYDIF